MVALCFGGCTEGLAFRGSMGGKGNGGFTFYCGSLLVTDGDYASVARPRCW